MKNLYVSLFSAVFAQSMLCMGATGVHSSDSLSLTVDQNDIAGFCALTLNEQEKQIDSMEKKFHQKIKSITTAPYLVTQRVFKVAGKHCYGLTFKEVGILRSRNFNDPIFESVGDFFEGMPVLPETLMKVLEPEPDQNPDLEVITHVYGTPICHEPVDRHSKEYQNLLIQIDKHLYDMWHTIHWANWREGSLPVRRTDIMFDPGLQTTPSPLVSFGFPELIDDKSHDIEWIKIAGKVCAGVKIFFHREYPESITHFHRFFSSSNFYYGLPVKLVLQEPLSQEFLKDIAQIQVEKPLVSDGKMLIQVTDLKKLTKKVGTSIHLHLQYVTKLGIPVTVYNDWVPSSSMTLFEDKVLIHVEKLLGRNPITLMPTMRKFVGGRKIKFEMRVQRVFGDYDTGEMTFKVNTTLTKNLP